MGSPSGMALDTSCGGTTLVSGTTFGFMAGPSGSGACPVDTNLVFGNVSPNDWSNLLVTASTDTALTGPLTCDPGTAFLKCTATFDPTALLYRAFFFGEDANHLGIPISQFIDGEHTNEFGFTFSGFPADQSFTATANVSAVPEPSTAPLMFGGLVLAVALSIRTRVAKSSVGQWLSVTSLRSRH